MLSSQELARLPTVLKPFGDDQGANTAVVLLLKPTLEDVEILIVRRAVREKDTWSGQMALPGGKRDPQDTNLKDTVIRETIEETGIDIGKAKFLGVLPTVQSTPRHDLLILPFVVVLDDDPEIRLNKSELESFIWVPYEKILKSKGITTQLGYGEVAAYLLSDAVVWGVTYRIISSFVRAVEDLRKK